MNILLSLFILLLLISFTLSYLQYPTLRIQSYRISPKSSYFNIQKNLKPIQAAEVIGTDLPAIPLLIGTIVAVFAVFNINNDVDLTDAGRAKARAQRKAQGPTIIEKGLNKIGIQLPEDDDSIDMINKGGGCG